MEITGAGKILQWAENENADFKKYRLRLSAYAMYILDNDHRCFYPPEEKVTYDRFVTDLLTRFYNYTSDQYTVESSIAFACKTYCGTLPKAAQKAAWAETQQRLIGKARERMKRFPRKPSNEVAKLFPQDDPLCKTVYINRTDGIRQFFGFSKTPDAAKELRAIEESNVTDTDGKPVYKTFEAYLCTLLEEYAGLPYSLRERIRFRETCEAIEAGVRRYHGDCEIRFKMQNGSRYRLRPYAVPILSDAVLPYNYLVGHGCIDGREDYAKGVCSFRLSMIQPSIEVFEDSARDQSPEMRRQRAIARAQIDRAIRIYGVAYLSAIPSLENQWICAEVLFTEKGALDLRRQLPNRPECKFLASRPEDEPEGTELWLLTGYAWKLELYLMSFGTEAHVRRSWRAENLNDTYRFSSSYYDPEYYDPGNNDYGLAQKLAARHYQAFKRYAISPDTLPTKLDPLPSDGDPVDKEEENLQQFLKVASSLPKLPQREEFASEEEYLKAAAGPAMDALARLFKVTRAFPGLSEEQIKEMLNPDAALSLLLGDDDADAEDADKDAE